MNPTYARDNQLDQNEYEFTCFGYIYDDKYMLQPKKSIVLAEPLYQWSIQIAEPAPTYELESGLQRALESLQSPYIDESWVKPKASVFGKRGELVFNHIVSEPVKWIRGFAPENDYERLENRIVKVTYSLYSDYKAEIKAHPRAVSLMPKDFSLLWFVTQN